MVSTFINKISVMSLLLRKIRWTCLRSASYYPTSHGSKLLFIMKTSKHVFQNKLTQPTVKCNLSTEIDSDSDSEAETEITDFRNVLHHQHSDNVIEQLNQSSTIQHVFDVIEDNQKQLKPFHAAQAILVLWDLQKYLFHYPIDRSRVAEQLMQHPSFQKIINIIDKSNTELCFDELTCSLLYLHRIGISLQHPTLLQLISTIINVVKNQPEAVTLPGLSRFSVVIGSSSMLWCTLLLQNTIPLIIHNIQNCQSTDHLRLLSIALIHSRMLVTSSILEQYKNLVNNMLDNEVLDETNPKVILKCLAFLSFPYWSNQNNRLIKKLLIHLKGRLHTLQPRKIVLLHKVFHSQIEPAHMLEELRSTAENILLDETISTSSISPFRSELLACTAAFINPMKKKQFEELTLRHFNLSDFHSSANGMFKVLRNLKTSDRNLCNTYWSKLTQCIIQQPSEQQDFKLFRSCQRYMYFNNNMGGTYRFKIFEQEMIKLLKLEMKNGLTGIVPTKYSKAASFILAYSYDLQLKKEIINKILSIKEQLNIIDCLNLSRGMTIMVEFGRNNLKSDFLQYFVDLDACLNDCTWRHLENKNLTATDFCHLIRSYYNRKGVKDTRLFEELVLRISTIDTEYNSRLIKDLTLCLQSASCLAPKLLDNMSDYVANNDDVTPLIATKLLYCCYLLGYQTQNEQFLNFVGEMLVKEKETMTCLNLLEGCLALCFYQKIPKELVQFIFTVEFLERLDNELSDCYSKATFPMRVRHLLMELNRSICIDFPQFNVPWFHQKYCDEMASMEHNTDNPFICDAKKSLEKVVGEPWLLQSDCHTPYGYKINHLIILDKNNKPVGKYYENENDVSKIAVLLRPDYNYTSYQRNLKGSEQLQHRHLEMLGYRVVEISEYDWNSMFMSEPDIKQSVITTKIWPDR